jgi:hypothetical protein
VRFHRLGAEAMHDVARLKLGLTEDFVILLADQQACQG